jgi:hypothetical protein
VARLLEGDRKVEGGGRLGDAALLVREGDHLGGTLVLGLVGLLGLARGLVGLLTRLIHGDLLLAPLALA